MAREIRKHGESPIFALTPPLESLRTIVSLAATNVSGMKTHVRDPQSQRRTQISFVDICRAYFCAETDPNDPTYVELPVEDPDHGKKVGLLLKHMYGTRKAADGWHCEYAGRLTQEIGFEAGDTSACVFLHRARNFRCSVHGDDLTTMGCKEDLDWFVAELKKQYELKEKYRLGPAPTDHKEAVILNRIVRWTDKGLEYEADPRQAETNHQKPEARWRRSQCCGHSGCQGCKRTARQRCGIRTQQDDSVSSSRCGSQLLGC